MNPVLFPSAISMACKYAHTDPFPFVPATWTIFLSAAGLPNLFKNVFVCSSVCFFVNFGISSIYAAASSYVNVSGSYLVNIIILIHPRFALIGCCAFLFYKLSVLICVLIRHPEYRITGTNLSNLNHITVF